MNVLVRSFLQLQLDRDIEPAIDFFSLHRFKYLPQLQV